MSKFLRYFLFLLFFGVGFLYSYLAFIHVVPSVFHISVIRKLWDSHYAQCKHHRQMQANAAMKYSLYVTLSPHGQLANRLFQYASLIGIAKKNNRIPFVEPFYPLTRIFNLQILTLKNSRLPICMDSLKDYLPCTYDRQMERLPVSNLSLDGYLQSWKYFQGYEREIHDQFRFRDMIMRNADEIFKYRLSKRESTDLYISVHVRRTDMMIPSSTRLGFKAAPLEYILNAMTYMRKKFSSSTIRFVTISDDYSWCSRFLSFNDNVIIPTNSKEVDLALLTKCNHSIITTGTFGWWGAWLAGGHTVYYRNFPEKGSKLDGEMNKSDFYPPDWVAIDTASFIQHETVVLTFTVIIGLSYSLNLCFM